MADPFATALRALHASVGAVVAVYQPPIGDPLSIRVIRNQASRDVEYGESSLRMDAEMVQIRRSDVAAPAIGAGLVLDGVTFRISAEPKLDVEGLTWWCELEQLPG